MDPFSTFSVFITLEKIIIQQMPETIVNMNITVMYMDISIKSVEFICFILSLYKLCLFAHLADSYLLPGACQLFHFAFNVFVPNGERLHLVFPLSRWFIMSCYFSSAVVCWLSSITRLADAITPPPCPTKLSGFSLPHLFAVIFVQQHVPSVAFSRWR